MLVKAPDTACFKSEKDTRATKKIGPDPFGLDLLLALTYVEIFSVLLSMCRHHRNFLPVDYGLEGWQSRSDNFQKIRSLPSESEQMEMDDNNARLAASWSDSTSAPITTKTSPQICVQRETSQRNSERSLFDGVSERSSYDSDESSHFLADHETDPGSYSSSRKPSFSSVRSIESGTENVDRRTAGAKHSNLSSRQQSAGMLSRSSSSRSAFLSVPTRVPNNSLWLSATSDQTDNNKLSRLQQPSLQSQMGSMSSLMASRLSLSK